MSQIKNRLSKVERAVIGPPKTRPVLRISPWTPQDEADGILNTPGAFIIERVIVDPPHSLTTENSEDD